MKTVRGDLSVAEWLDKLNSITQNLALAGDLISDKELINHILATAGPMYETTVTGALSREHRIDYLGLEALLLGAERRLQASQLPLDTVATVLAVNRGSRGSNGGGCSQTFSRESSGGGGNRNFWQPRLGGSNCSGGGFNRTGSGGGFSCGSSSPS